MNGNWLTDMMFRPELKEALNVAAPETQVFSPPNHRKIYMLALKEHISSSIFWVPLLDMIECEVRRRGYVAQMCIVDEGSAEFLDDETDGYIFIGNISLAVFEMVEKTKRPIVWIFNNRREGRTDQVCVNNRHGTYMMACHAVDLGHRRLAFLQASHDRFVLDFEERYQGMLLCAQDYAERGVKCELLKMDSLESLVDMMTRKDRPTFIQASNDSLALDVIRLAKQLLIRVPEDLAVVGFDNIQASYLSNPPLTTVSMPFLDIAISTVQLLDKRIKMPMTAQELIQVQPTLIMRESLAPPSAKPSGEKSTATSKRGNRK